MRQYQHPAVRRLVAYARREVRHGGASVNMAGRRAVRDLRYGDQRYSVYQMQAAIEELASRAITSELTEVDREVVDAKARLSALERRVQQAEWRLRTLERQECESVQRSGRREVVYFMDFGLTIKIGKTRDLDARVRSLKPRSVLAVEPGYTALERELHQRFSHLRVRVPGNGGTEHFTRCTELMDYIAAIAAEEEAAA